MEEVINLWKTIIQKDNHFKQIIQQNQQSWQQEVIKIIQENTETELEQLILEQQSEENQNLQYLYLKIHQYIVQQNKDLVLDQFQINKVLFDILVSEYQVINFKNYLKSMKILKSIIDVYDEENYIDSLQESINNSVFKEFLQKTQFEFGDLEYDRFRLYLQFLNQFDTQRYDEVFQNEIKKYIKQFEQENQQLEQNFKELQQNVLQDYHKEQQLDLYLDVIKEIEQIGIDIQKFVVEDQLKIMSVILITKIEDFTQKNIQNFQQEDKNDISENEKEEQINDKIYIQDSQKSINQDKQQSQLKIQSDDQSSKENFNEKVTNENEKNIDIEKSQKSNQEQVQSQDKAALLQNLQDNFKTNLNQLNKELEKIEQEDVSNFKLENQNNSKIEKEENRQLSQKNLLYYKIYQNIKFDVEQNFYEDMQEFSYQDNQNYAMYIENILRKNDKILDQSLNDFEKFEIFLKQFNIEPIDDIDKTKYFLIYQLWKQSKKDIEQNVQYFLETNSIICQDFIDINNEQNLQASYNNVIDSIFEKFQILKQKFQKYEQKEFLLFVQIEGYQQDIEKINFETLKILFQFLLLNNDLTAIPEQKQQQFQFKEPSSEKFDLEKSEQYQIKIVHKNLKNIYDHYCRLQLIRVNIKESFDSYQNTIQNLKLPEFLKLCLDFDFRIDLDEKINKQKLMSLFKLTSNRFGMKYKEFQSFVMYIAQINQKTQSKKSIDEDIKQNILIQFLLDKNFHNNEFIENKKRIINSFDSVIERNNVDMLIKKSIQRWQSKELKQKQQIKKKLDNRIKRKLTKIRQSKYFKSIQNKTVIPIQQKTNYESIERQAEKVLEKKRLKLKNKALNSYYHRSKFKKTNMLEYSYLNWEILNKMSKTDLLQRYGENFNPRFFYQENDNDYIKINKKTNKI